MTTKQTTEQKDPKRIVNGTKVKLNGTEGVTLFFWPKGVRPHADWIRRIEAGQQVFDGWTSSRDRYLVEVERTSKRSGCLLPPTYYAPMAGGLERANPKAKRA